MKNTDYSMVVQNDNETQMGANGNRNGSDNNNGNRNGSDNNNGNRNGSDNGNRNEDEDENEDEEDQVILFLSQNWETDARYDEDGILLRMEVIRQHPESLLYTLATCSETAPTRIVDTNFPFRALLLIQRFYENGTWPNPDLEGNEGLYDIDGRFTDIYSLMSYANLPPHVEIIFDPDCAYDSDLDSDPEHPENNDDSEYFQ